MSAIGQKKSFERHRFVLFLSHFFQQSWTCEFHHGKTVSQKRLGPQPSVPHLIRMNKNLWSQGGGPSGLGFGSMEGVSVKWLLTCLNPVPYLSCCVFVGRGFQKFKCWFLWGCLYPFDTPPNGCSKWQICTKLAKNMALAILWSRNVLPSCDVKLCLKLCWKTDSKYTFH